VNVFSDSIVQPNGQHWFRNVSNFDLVETNQIRDSIYACIRLLLANFFDNKNVAYMLLPFDNVRF